MGSVRLAFSPQGRLEARQVKVDPGVVVTIRPYA